MSESLVESLKNGVSMLRRKDDDMFDRLSNRYTIGFLVCSSLFLATKTYVGDPIDCFTPQEYHDNWVAYTDNYCWIKNTYYIPIDKDLPSPTEQKHDESSGPEIPYYQWVPIILAFMMAVFAIPAYFWKFSMWSSGYDIEAIISVASEADNINPELRDETNKYIVAQLDRHITFHRHLDGHGKIALGNKYGRYLYFMYVITKCLYISVPIILLFMLNTMMGPGYSNYGVTALQGLMSYDPDYLHNPMFPTITLCDFSVRKFGSNLHPYTVQCVLTVNLFNEKVFLIIWWWLVILTVLSALGLVICLIKALRPNGGNDFILKYLKLMRMIDEKSESDQNLVKTFTGQYLSLDGVFCMRLIAQNTTDVISAEIISELFKCWKNMHAEKGGIKESKSLLTDEAA